MYFESIEFSKDLKAIRTVALLKDLALPLDWKTEWPWTVVALLWFDNDDNCYCFFKHSQKKKKKTLSAHAWGTQLRAARRCERVYRRVRWCAGLWRLSVLAAALEEICAWGSTAFACEPIYYAACPHNIKSALDCNTPKTTVRRVWTDADHNNITLLYTHVKYRKTYYPAHINVTKLFKLNTKRLRDVRHLLSLFWALYFERSTNFRQSKLTKPAHYLPIP